MLEALKEGGRKPVAVVHGVGWRLINIRPTLVRVRSLRERASERGEKGGREEWTDGRVVFPVAPSSGAAGALASSSYSFLIRRGRTPTRLLGVHVHARGWSPFRLMPWSCRTDIHSSNQK